MVSGSYARFCWFLRPRETKQPGNFKDTEQQGSAKLSESSASVNVKTKTNKSLPLKIYIFKSWTTLKLTHDDMQAGYYLAKSYRYCNEIVMQNQP